MRDPGTSSHLSSPCLLFYYSLPASSQPRPHSTSLLALGDSSLSSPDPASAHLPWHCAACAMLNEPWAVLCVACDWPRGCKVLGLGIEGPQETRGLEPELARGRWACQSCTFENEAAAVLCAICERPRLAQPPSLVVDSHDAGICPQPLKVTCSWPCSLLFTPVTSGHPPLLCSLFSFSSPNSLYFHYEPLLLSQWYNSLYLPSRVILYSPLPRLKSGTVFTVPSATRALAGCVLCATGPAAPSQYSMPPSPMPALWKRDSQSLGPHDASVLLCPVPVETLRKSVKTRCGRKVSSL